MPLSQPRLHQLAEPARAVALAEYRRLRESHHSRSEALRLAVLLAQEWSATRGGAAESVEDRPGTLELPEQRSSRFRV